jgi:phosphatidylserine/phosphatidylglycerophosphate/cardiolipin synthase-like enzyme
MDKNFNRITTVLENEVNMVESSIDMLITNMIANNKTQQDIQTSLEQIKEKSNELATIDVIRELLKENIKEIDKSVDMKHIQNYEIKNYFYRALDEAKHEVCIISPWISNWVVTDSDIQARFEKLLTSGVNIKILFGITGNSSSMNDDRRGEKTEQVVKTLKSKFTKKRHTGKLQFGKVNSHYKLFICDDEFFVESSMNILSNKGDYGEGFQWHEGGTYSEHQKTLSTLKDIYFGPNNPYTI